MKLFGTVFFIVTCFFLLWVVLAGTPLGRINRTCTPAEWVGRFATTTGAAVSSDAEGSTRRGANTLYDTCRFYVFRMFYAEDYAALVAQQQGQSPAASSADKPAAPASTAHEGGK